MSALLTLSSAIPLPPPSPLVSTSKCQLREAPKPVAEAAAQAGYPALAPNNASSAALLQSLERALESGAVERNRIQTMLAYQQVYSHVGVLNKEPERLGSIINTAA